MNDEEKTQTVTILVADQLLGPYTKVREGFRPLGMNAGDFDLAVVEDGKAYYYFERVHSETICADLTEDYLDVTGYYSTHFPLPYPPYVREGIAHFTRKGKHYLFTSGTTSYLPNHPKLQLGIPGMDHIKYFRIRTVTITAAPPTTPRFHRYLRWKEKRICILR